MPVETKAGAESGTTTVDNATGGSTTDTQIAADSQASQEVSSTNTPQKVDLWDTTGLDEPRAKAMKDLQREYNSKAEKAKRVEELEAKHAQLTATHNAVLADIRATLADEDRYRAYQKQMGIAPKQAPTSEKPPDFKFIPSRIAREDAKVEDLIADMEISVSKALEARDAYWQNIRQADKAALESMAESRIRSVAMPVEEQKWANALESMKSQYGNDFSDVEAKVVDLICGPYNSLKGTMPEKALLDKVFKAEFPDVLVNARLKQIESDNARAKAAQTEAPSKKAPPDLPKGNSAEAIMARAKARNPKLFS